MKLRALYQMKLNITFIGAFPFEKGTKIGDDFLICKFFMDAREDFTKAIQPFKSLPAVEFT
jgi:hypothetical protein